MTHGSTSGSSSSSSSGTSSTDPCASLAPQCAADQQGCVVGDAGPVCSTCPAGSYASTTGECTTISGTPLSHQFPDQTTTSGQEVLGLCRSWTLNNDSDIWVSAVELTQNEFSHHSNWVFVPDTAYAGPDGIWKCSDRSYDFYQGLAKGGLLYAQSTQATHEVQHFANGAAIKVPAHSKIVSDIHLLNTTPMSNTGHATLTMYTQPASAVTAKLTAFHVEYDALTIPPMATSQFTATCSVAQTVSTDQNAPYAPKLYYLLPHTHTLATGFFAKILGGPSDGQMLLDLGAYNGEAHGKIFDPPLDLSGSDGFTFACKYTNTRSTEVGWGFGSQEMCELFGFAETPEFFQSRVNTGTSVGTDAQGVQEFAGNCDTQVIASP